jgi:hypothetical protein
MTWISYTTANGKDVVRAERDKLLDYRDDERLSILLEEVAMGTALAGSDFKKLRSRHDLWEVRFSVTKYTYRLIYSRLPGRRRAEAGAGMRPGSARHRGRPAGPRTTTSRTIC